MSLSCFSGQSVPIALRVLWAVFLVAAVSTGFAADDPNRPLTLVDEEGRSFEARILTVDKRVLLVERLSPKQMFTQPFDDLSATTQAQVIEWVRNFIPGPMRRELERRPKPKLRASSSLRGQVRPAGVVPEIYYPRSMKEVIDGARQIQERPQPAGFTEMHLAALTELNLIRFLCGVPADVRLSADLNNKAQQAAEACWENDAMSHDLGRFTESCNLAMGNESLPGAIKQYIDDIGENNRVARGHRLWCLHDEMQETGFGIVGGRFSAMWVISSGGEKATKSYAYPGKGFFPKDHVYGVAWSLYLLKPAPPAEELKVEFHRLTRRPVAEVPIDLAIPGEKFEVQFVATSQNAINFEPSDEVVNQAGVYFIRITGGGVAEQYVVELF